MSEEFLEGEIVPINEVESDFSLDLDIYFSK